MLNSLVSNGVYQDRPIGNISPVNNKYGRMLKEINVASFILLPFSSQDNFFFPILSLSFIGTFYRCRNNTINVSENICFLIQVNFS
jgi:hypothetical protein